MRCIAQQVVEQAVLVREVIDEVQALLDVLVLGLRLRRPK
jgi:hypothetical protein